MEDAHTKTVDEVIKYFAADPERGLTAEQVKKNQEKYGPNGEFASFFLLLLCISGFTVVVDYLAREFIVKSCSLIFR